MWEDDGNIGALLEQMQQAEKQRASDEEIRRNLRMIQLDPQLPPPFLPASQEAMGPNLPVGSQGLTGQMGPPPPMQSAPPMPMPQQGPTDYSVQGLLTGQAGGPAPDYGQHLPPMARQLGDVIGQLPAPAMPPGLTPELQGSWNRAMDQGRVNLEQTARQTGLLPPSQQTPMLHGENSRWDNPRSVYGVQQPTVFTNGAAFFPGSGPMPPLPQPETPAAAPPQQLSPEMADRLANVRWYRTDEGRTLMGGEAGDRRRAQDLADARQVMELNPHVMGEQIRAQAMRDAHAADADQREYNRWEANRQQTYNRLMTQHPNADPRVLNQMADEAAGGPPQRRPQGALAPTGNAPLPSGVPAGAVPVTALPQTPDPGVAERQQAETILARMLMDQQGPAHGPLNDASRRDLIGNYLTALQARQGNQWLGRNAQTITRFLQSDPTISPGLDSFWRQTVPWWREGGAAQAPSWLPSAVSGQTSLLPSWLASEPTSNDQARNILANIMMTAGATPASVQPRSNGAPALFNLIYGGQTRAPLRRLNLPR